MKLYRDDKGRFVKGHTSLTPRDKVTGKFVKKTTDKEQDRYTKVRAEVDYFLADYRMAM